MESVTYISEMGYFLQLVWTFGHFISIKMESRAIYSKAVCLRDWAYAHLSLVQLPSRPILHYYGWRQEIKHNPSTAFGQIQEQVFHGCV